MSKSFLVILTSFFTVFTLYVKIKYVDTELRQFIFPLLAYGLTVYGSIFFEKKHYIKTISLITFALCSIFFIIMQTNQVVPFTGKDYLIYVAFSISVANILTLSKQIFGGGQDLLDFCGSFVNKPVSYNSFVGILFFIWCLAECGILYGDTSDKSI